MLLRCRKGTAAESKKNIGQSRIGCDWNRVNCEKRGRNNIFLQFILERGWHWIRGRSEWLQEYACNAHPICRNEVDAIINAGIMLWRGTSVRGHIKLFRLQMDMEKYGLQKNAAMADYICLDNCENNMSLTQRIILPMLAISGR